MEDMTALFERMVANVQMEPPMRVPKYCLPPLALD